MIHDIQQLLEQALKSLIDDGIVPDDTVAEVQVERAKDASHGDLATNLAMRLAKPARRKPRELAEALTTAIPHSKLIDTTDIAGPGFINFFFDNTWLRETVQHMAASARAAVRQADTPSIVVVDYSAPNIAKEMHVGHIRSTIIGDTMARTLEFLGHRVIRANHVGDWGTQFGMLIAHLEELRHGDQGALDNELADLETFYREAKKRYDNDEEFAAKARSYVVRLQGGDDWCVRQWQDLVDITMVQNQRCYDRLNVTLTRDDTMGESLYNDMLPAIVEDLLSRGIAVEDNDAVVVFLDEYKTKDGDSMGVIIRKKDGGFLYATTDIACAKYRYEQLDANRIIYCVDSRQSQHLQQAWTIARRAGYIPDEVPTEHHAFGMMLGKDGKPFKTREGGTIRLVDLLEEGHDRARAMVSEKNPELDAETLEHVSEAVGIGAIKYADLSKNRTTDYVFDWDHMLSFDGNTAPYLQYAYTRIVSVMEKAGAERGELHGPVTLAHDTELMLARTLVWFEETLNSVAEHGTPHQLCGYLYELSRQFTRFYENCPINKDDVEPAVRNSRLRLCAAVANVLETGLGLLGIVVLDRM